MRVFLIGSKELSCLILDTLMEQGHEVLGVYVRDNEPGMKIWHELGHRSLATEARKLGIPVHHDMKVNSPESHDLLMQLNLDLILSCFWSEIFKEPLLNIPKLGVYNFHTAYLPKNRGSRPIPWAMIKGEDRCGITVHRMMTGIDNGPIVAQSAVDITSTDTGESLYNKVVTAGGKLAKKVIEEFANNTFTLTLQDEDAATYQPRGEPFGGQINPYWSPEEKDRFERAFTFPPFKGAVSAPPKALDGRKPRLYVMLGFDCDKPRGIDAFSEKGRKLAERSLQAMESIKEDLDREGMKRSYFLSGQFLESMATLLGKGHIASLVGSQHVLTEIGDYTYHHELLKPAPDLANKKVLTPSQLKSEINLNTAAFEEILDDGNEQRGFRAPFGFFEGLKGAHRTLDTLQRCGIRYVSSDMRDEKNSPHSKLYDSKGNLRQPYRYENGLLEIPTVGWPDTLYSDRSSTSDAEDPASTFDEIFDYFNSLFDDAQTIVQKNDRDLFLALTLKPLEISYDNELRQLFPRLKQLLDALNGEFLTYGEVCDHYNSTYD